MKTAMLGLLAETSIHPGAGRGMGVVDLPVARETATDYPVLVGSSLKGALRDKADAAQRDLRFGKPEHAGDLLVSDARLLLLPVRSLTGSYRWATCPHLIERFRRDLTRAGLTPAPIVPVVECKSVLAAGTGPLFLEERQFTINDELPDDLVKAIAPLLLHEETQGRLDCRVVVLHDDDFAWFVRYGPPHPSTQRSRGRHEEEQEPVVRGDFATGYGHVRARHGPQRRSGRRAGLALPRQRFLPASRR